MVVELPMRKSAVYAGSSARKRRKPQPHIDPAAAVTDVLVPRRYPAPYHFVQAKIGANEGLREKRRVQQTRRRQSSIKLQRFSISDQDGFSGGNDTIAIGV